MDCFYLGELMLFSWGAPSVLLLLVLVRFSWNGFHRKINIKQSIEVEAKILKKIPETCDYTQTNIKPEHGSQGDSDRLNIIQLESYTIFVVLFTVL